MRELKIFIVIAVGSIALYLGVETYAHTQLHPNVDAPDYAFTDIEDVRNGNIGNVSRGKSLIVDSFQCQSCHSITIDGNKIGNSIDLGVIAPDITNAGLIYNEKYLAAFIANPAKASKTEDKYIDGKTHPMTNFDLNFDGIFGDDDAQAVADIVSFLKSISPEKLTNKEVFQDACQRCHSIKYGDFYGGSMNANSDVTAYMGKTPPDLSQYIRSRSENYLHEFINDPRKHLTGTAMPRVGLTLNAENQVIEYMSEVGDSKKSQREKLGPIALSYLALFAIFAWLWKIKIWREVH